MSTNLAPIVPATKAIAVTPSDSAKILDGTIVVMSRGLSIDTAGVIVFKDENGVTRTSGTLVANVIHPISTNQVMLTNTTALGIVAYW